jgi:hypothetical protein
LDEDGKNVIEIPQPVIRGELPPMDYTPLKKANTEWEEKLRLISEASQSFNAVYLNARRHSIACMRVLNKIGGRRHSDKGMEGMGVLKEGGSIEEHTDDSRVGSEHENFVEFSKEMIDEYFKGDTNDVKNDNKIANLTNSTNGLNLNQLLSKSKHEYNDDGMIHETEILDLRPNSNEKNAKNEKNEVISTSRLRYMYVYICICVYTRARARMTRACTCQHA